MIQFLICVPNLTFLDFDIVHDILVLNVCLKNEFFKTCFRQSAKCKMTAQTRRNLPLIKTKLYNWICHENLDFQAPPPFVSSLSA